MASKGKSSRKKTKEVILLKCTESGRINYTAMKDKKKNPERIELKKYCPVLRKHTLHKEVKK